MDHIPVKIDIKWGLVTYVKSSFRTSFSFTILPKSASLACWNSAHANGGPRSLSKHTRPFAQPPIDMSGIFLAHMSGESPLNISPNPSEVISSFGTLVQILKFSKKNKKNLKTAPTWDKPLVKFQNSNWPPSKIFKKYLKKPKNCPPGGQGVGVRILFFYQNFYLY